MATLNAVINVTDNMTPALKVIANQLDRVNSGLDSLNKHANGIGNSTGKASSAINQLGNSVGDADGKFKSGTKGLSGFTDGLKNLLQAAGAMKAVSVVTGTINSSIGSAIQRIDTMSTFQRKMEMITGSSEEASSALEQLRTITKGTAYGLDVAAQGVQNFVTRGMKTQDAVNSVNVWSNAVSAFGRGTNAELETVMDALGKMRTKGTIEMEQMSRLFDIGLNPIEDYAKATGRTANEVQEDLTAKRITTEEFLSVVEKAYQEGTNGVINVMNQGKAAGTTWTATIDNMRAACTRGMVSIVEAVDNAFKVLNPDGLKGMVAGYGKVFEEVATNISGGIGSALSGGLTSLKSYWDSFNNLPDLTQKVNTLFQSLSEGVNKILPPLSAILGETFKVGAENLSKFVNWAVELGNVVIPPLFDKVSEILTNLKDNVLPVVDKLFGSVVDSLMGLGSAVIPPSLSWMADNLDGILITLTAIVTAYETYKATITAINVVQAIYNGLIGIKNTLDTAYLAYALTKNGMTLAEVAATNLATGAQIGLNMALLACPITWIIAGIIAVVAVIAILWTKSEGFRNFWIGAWDGIKNVAGKVGDWLGNFFGNTLPSLYENAKSGIKSWADNMGEHLQGMASNINDWYGQTSDKVGGFIGGMSDGASQIWSSVKGFFGEIGSQLSGVWNSIVGVVSGVSQRVNEEFTIINRVFEWAGGVLSAKWEEIKTIFWNALEPVRSALSAIQEFINTNFITPVVNAFNYVTEAIGNAWNSIVAKFNEALGYLVLIWQQIQTALDQYLVQPFLNGFNGVREYVVNVWNGVVEAFSTAYNNLLTHWNNLQNGVRMYLIDPFMGALNTARDNIYNTWLGIVDAFSIAYNNLMIHWNNLVSAINTFLIEPISTFLNGLWSVVSNTWNSIVTAFANAYNSISGLITTLMSIFGQARDYLAQKFSEIWQAFVTARDQLLNTQNDVGTIFLNLYNTVVGKVSEIVDGLRNFGWQAVQAIADFGTSFYETGKNLIQGFINGISEKFSEPIESIKQFGNNLLSGLKEVLNIHSPSVETQQIGAYFIQGFKDEVEARMPELHDLVNNKMNELLGLVGLRTDEMVSTVENKFSAISPNLDAQLIQISEVVMTRWNTLADGAIGIIQRLSDEIINRMNILQSGIETILNMIIEITLNKTEELRQRLIPVVKRVVNSVQNTVNVLPGYFFNIGQTMMSDFANGINSSKQQVIDATSTLVQQLKDVFEGGLGIHSPSRYTFWVGQMTGSGLINGLASSQDKVNKFVDAIIGDMKSSFEGGNFNATELVNYLKDESTLNLIARITELDKDSLNNLQSTIAYPLIGTLGSQSSWFGNRPYPGAGGSTNHGGVDLATDVGVGIAAALGGTVTTASYSDGYGNLVTIDHGNGLETYYGHMSSFATEVGNVVSKGQKIGEVGSTGNSTGPHLHFEIRQNGTRIDPQPYIEGSATLSGGNTLAGVIQQALDIKNGKFAKGVAGMIGPLSDSSLVGIVSKALQLTGQSQSLIGSILYAIQCESGGNPNAINDWDSNWLAGHPSVGLLQVIQPTFDAYALPGYDTNIWDPLQNVIAGIRWMIASEGSIENVVNPRIGNWSGYEVGTRNVPEDMLAPIHKGEAILPRTQNPYSQSGGEYLAEIGQKITEQITIPNSTGLISNLINLFKPSESYYNHDPENSDRNYASSPSTNSYSSNNKTYYDNRTINFNSNVHVNSKEDGENYINSLEVKLHELLREGLTTAPSI